MATRRNWVIEGVVSTVVWVAIPGHIYDNKRDAFRKLRELRKHWMQYPANTFRIAEYVRKAQ